jgi:hypothetical protein
MWLAPSIYLLITLLHALWDGWQGYKYNVVGDALDLVYAVFLIFFAIIFAYRLFRSVFSNKRARAAGYGAILVVIIAIHVFSYQSEHAKMWVLAALFNSYPDLCRNGSPVGEHFYVCYHYYISLGLGFDGPDQWLVFDDRNISRLPYSRWPQSIQREFFGSMIRDTSLAKDCEFGRAVYLAWHLYWITSDC